MFQIGGLIVFCGLLALPLPGALAQALPLPGGLASNPTDLAGQLAGALGSGLVSGGLLDSIQNLPLLDTLKTDGDTSGGLIGKLLQQVINPLGDFTGIEITKPKILEIGLVPSEDGHRIFLNVPLSFDIKLRSPIAKLGLLKLSVKLNASVEVFPEKDDDGVHLVVGDCSQAPASLEIALLDGKQSFLTERIVNSLISALSKAVPKLVLSQVCSRVNGILSQLDVSTVKNIVDTLITQKNIVLNL